MHQRHEQHNKVRMAKLWNAGYVRNIVSTYVMNITMFSIPLNKGLYEAQSYWMHELANQAIKLQVYLLWVNTHI